MEHQASVGLEHTVTDLEEVVRRLDRILPEVEAGSLREDLQQMQDQSEAAIVYYRSLIRLSIPPKSSAPEPLPEIVARAAQAAVVPINGLGLQMYGFALPGLPSKKSNS